MKLQRACGLSVCRPGTAAINTTSNHETSVIHDKAKGVNEVLTSLLPLTPPAFILRRSEVTGFKSSKQEVTQTHLVCKFRALER